MKRYLSCLLMVLMMMIVGNLSDQIFHAPITYACSDGGAPDFPIPLYLVGTISDVETPAQDLIVSWETLDGEYTNGSGNTLAPIIEEITWTIILNLAKMNYQIGQISFLSELSSE